MGILSGRRDPAEMFTPNRARTSPSRSWHSFTIVFLPFHRSRKNSKAEGHPRGQEHVRKHPFRAYIDACVIYAGVHSWPCIPRSKGTARNRRRIDAQKYQLAPIDTARFPATISESNQLHKIPNFIRVHPKSGFPDRLLNRTTVNYSFQIKRCIAGNDDSTKSTNHSSSR